MTETWRPIPGYDGRYEISDEGRVRSFVRSNGKILASHPNRDEAGSVRLRLSMDGVRTTHTLGRLVLEAFVGPAPEGMECCHNDGNFRNNHLSNLRWDTRSENMLDQVRHGTHVESKKTHCAGGHPLKPLGSTGVRGCRKCQAAQARKRRRSEGKYLTTAVLGDVAAKVIAEHDWYSERGDLGKYNCRCGDKDAKGLRPLAHAEHVAELVIAAIGDAYLIADSADQISA